jgi:glycosyltransferase involved in cell wall biosynthesis
MLGLSQNLKLESPSPGAIEMNRHALQQTDEQWEKIAPSLPKAVPSPWGSPKGAPKGKVLIIVENLPVPNDRRVWLEATTLRDAGYQVSVISITGKNARKYHEVLSGISIYRYPAPPLTKGTISFIFEFSYCWISTFILSIIVLSREGFDIIHACNPPETFWLIALFYKLFGKKFLFDHHDLSPEMYFSRFGRQGLVYKILLLLEKLTFMSADVVITTNETHRQVAIERGKFPPEKVFIVRSGPNHHVFRPHPPDEALKRGRRYMVSYLGVLNPQDGVDLFIQAADYIVHTLQRRDIQFIIMGSGDAEEDLYKLSETLGLNKEVYFTGWLELESITDYLSTSDICVDSMPKSPYSDAATMNKILEYMAAARPIVTFDLVESRISAQDAAVYAYPNDVTDLAKKIVALLEDESQRTRMGKVGRERIETKLSWEHSEPYLRAAYELVKKHRGSQDSLWDGRRGSLSKRNNDAFQSLTKSKSDNKNPVL